MKRKRLLWTVVAVFLAIVVAGGAFAMYNRHMNAVDIENVSLGDTYAQKYNGKKCSVMKNSVRCNCYGCKSGSWDPTTCSRCGHKCNKHTR